MVVNCLVYKQISDVHELGRIQEPMKIIIRANHRWVIVLRLHIESNFSLAFIFFHWYYPPFIINRPEKVNCCNFLFVFTFVGDFGPEFSLKRAVRG